MCKDNFLQLCFCFRTQRLCNEFNQNKTKQHFLQFPAKNEFIVVSTKCSSKSHVFLIKDNRKLFQQKQHRKVALFDAEIIVIKNK